MDRQTDRQTNTQTDMLNTILCSPTGGGLMKEKVRTESRDINVAHIADLSWLLLVHAKEHLTLLHSTNKLID